MLTLARRTVSAGRWRAAAAAIFIVLRLPSLTIRLFNSDEASLATMARVIAHGGRLYRDTADRKPPLAPYLYAEMFRLTGTTDLRWVRVVAAIVLAATAAVLASEAIRRYESREAGVAAAVLFILGVSAFFPTDSQAATFELFMLLPMSVSVTLAARGRAAPAGVSLALACLCKQTALTAVVPVAILVYRRRGLTGAAAAAAGLAVPIAAAAWFFGPGAFLLWNVTGNGGYLRDVGPVGAAILRGAGMTVALGALEVGLVALCVTAARRRLVGIDLWLWLASSAAAVAVGFRFFGHYYLQLVPAAALIAAPALLAVAPRARRTAILALAVPAVVMSTVGFFPTGDMVTIPYVALADKVRALTRSTDRVFVWGELPELYWAAQRDPSTRFIHTGFLTGNTGGRPNGLGSAATGIPGAWRMLAEDLARQPPALIVDTSSADIRQQQLYPMAPTLVGRLVRADYRLVAVVDRVRLYRRRPG